MNRVIYTLKSIKQLRKIDKAYRINIKIKADELSNMPRCENVKSLKNHQYSYRLRVGNYRVFFEFDGEIKIVEVKEIKKRDERTY